MAARGVLWISMPVGGEEGIVNNDDVKMKQCKWIWIVDDSATAGPAWLNHPQQGQSRTRREWKAATRRCGRTSKRSGRGGGSAPNEEQSCKGSGFWGALFSVSRQTSNLLAHQQFPGAVGRSVCCTRWCRPAGAVWSLCSRHAVAFAFGRAAASRRGGKAALIRSVGHERAVNDARRAFAMHSNVDKLPKRLLVSRPAICRTTPSQPQLCLHVLRLSLTRCGLLTVAGYVVCGVAAMLCQCQPQQ